MFLVLDMSNNYDIGESKIGDCSMCDKNTKVVLRRVKVKQPREGFTRRWLCQGCEEDTEALDEAEIVE